MEFKTVLDESQRIWKSEDGGPSAAVAYLSELLGSTADRTERGWLHSLLAQFSMRTKAWDRVFSHFEEAFELLDAPEAAPRRATALTSYLEACCDTRSVERGYRHAILVEEFFAAQTDSEVLNARAQFLHQYGRLSLLAGDAAAAGPRLREAADLFSAQGKKQESYMAAVRLAKALSRTGDLVNAEAVCRTVLLEASAELVRCEADLAMAEVQRLKGNQSMAYRYLEDATKLNAKRVGHDDYRASMEILLEQANLLECAGQPGAAQILRSVVNSQAAVTRISV